MSEQTKQSPIPATTDGQTPEHHFQHEAEKTELEKWIQTGLEKAKPHSNQLLMGVIGLVVLIVAVAFWAQSTGSARTAQWEEFVEQRVPDDYLELAKENPDSSVSSWALLQAGRGYLQEGMRNALTNREASDERLNEAVEAFDALVKKADAPPKAREEALFGLATAKEVLSGSDPGEAVQAYQKLIDDFPESRHVPWAKQRVQELNEDSTQQFYAWFREQNPKPEDRPLPGDLLPQDNKPAEVGNLDLLDDSTMKLPPTGVGAENTNTVPPESEKADKPEGQPADAPKGFPPAESPEKSPEKPTAEATSPENAKPDTETPAKEEPAPQEKAEEPAAKPEQPAAPAEQSAAEEPTADSSPNE